MPVGTLVPAAVAVGLRFLNSYPPSGARGNVEPVAVGLRFLNSYPFVVKREFFFGVAVGLRFLNSYPARALNLLQTNGIGPLRQTQNGALASEQRDLVRIFLPRAT